MPKATTQSPRKTDQPGSSPTKRSPRKKAAPEQQDRTTWRPSNIPSKGTINKTVATTCYRLSAEEIKHLPNVTTQIVKKFNGVDTVTKKILYNEREIEMVAWEKHGGPEGFANMLDKKEEAFRAKPANRGKPFSRPGYYPTNRVSSPFVGVMCFPSQTHTPNAETSTPYLLNKKATMLSEGDGWLWAAIDKAINACIDHGNETMWDAVDIRGATRETLVKAALRDFAYPKRPTAAPPTSSSFRALGAILEQAPVHDGGFEESPGLEIYEDFRSGDRDVSWASSYKDNVYAHLIQVVREHGLDGWEHARWLVYDQYIASNIAGLACSGVNYNGRQFVIDTDISWVDYAQFWLKVPDTRYNHGQAFTGAKEVYRLALLKIGAR